MAHRIAPTISKTKQPQHPPPPSSPPPPFPPRPPPRPPKNGKPPNSRPSFRSLPERVSGMPIARDMRPLAAERPEARFQENEKPNFFPMCGERERCIGKTKRQSFHTAPTAEHDPPAARIAPAQRAAREPTGTLHRHAACSPAASRPPPPAPRCVPASRRMRHELRPAACAAHPAPKSQARCALAGNHAHPSLARGCPCRQSSLARLRALSGSAPPWGCGAPRPSLRSGTRQRHRLPARWPCASRAPLLCSSHARGACAPASRCGGQSGKPSRRARELRAVRGRGRGSARERGAPREVRRGPPRFARTAPRPASAVACASLSPPRETSRSFGRPIARSGGASLPPSYRSRRLALSTSPATRLRHRMARDARTGNEQGRSPSRPRSSLTRGKHAARFACPLARIYGRKSRTESTPVVVSCVSFVTHAASQRT